MTSRSEIDADTVGYSAQDLATWSGGAWDPAPPAGMGLVVNDTRTLDRGQVYVALQGERFDGHTFVDEAARREAAGAIVRRNWQLKREVGLPLLRVADPGDALLAMAAAYRRRVAGVMVGITGSAGKTTLKELTVRAVAGVGCVARTQGNWNNRVGMPLSVLAMPPDTKVGVFEVGTSHPGELPELAAALRPDFGVVTNVGPGHVGNFGSVEAIADEKAAILRVLGPEGVAFLDRDGPWFDRLRAAATGRVVTVSTSGAADYRLRDPDVRGGLCVEETATGVQCHVPPCPPTPGWAVNVLFAVAIARQLGVGAKALAEALAAAPVLPMRWQRTHIGGLLVINDAYNANPLSMRAALEAFGAEPVVGRRWLVLGTMRELGTRTEDEHRAIGRALTPGPWAGLIAVGEGGRAIARGAEDAGWPANRTVMAADADAAARAIAERGTTGDAVLLKASRGEHFEDVEFALRGKLETVDQSPAGTRLNTNGQMRTA